MLVIRRRKGEALLIGEDVEIQVLEVSHGQVTLGIAAPGAVRILRKEVRVAELENLAASRALPERRLENLLQGFRR